NIAAMDCANSCLGGELLEDRVIAERGYKRFREFFRLIAENGNVFEFNSPTYTQVTLKALHLLRRYVKDPATRLLAELAATRLGLSVALHLHPQSGRLAGPYSRAYYPTLQPSSRAYSELLQTWIEEGIVPDWIGTVPRAEKLPFFLEETAHSDWRIGASTYLTPSFSMGLASREVSRQTNPLVIQVYGEDPSETAMIFARYSMNDSIEKEVPPKSAFGIDGSFFDDGKFLGVQQGNRAIGVYAPREAETPDSLAPASRHRFASARASLVWLDRKKATRIWVGENEVKELPHQVERGKVMVIETPPARIALLPLSITELGYDSPIRIAEKDGRLYLDMYNYLGEEKTFGELDRGSRFYRGQPQCAFYVEVADQSAHPDAPSFAREVAGGTVRDGVAPPFTSYRDDARRPWVLEYAREGKTLGLEVDLMEWRLLRRWNENGDLGWPMLESPMARQNSQGRIELAGATLECGKAPALLYGDPAAGLWVAAYYGDPAPLSLSLPGGSVRIERMGPGTLAWRKGEVTLDTLDLEGPPKIVGGALREREKGVDQ
ncbi:MAG: hypothetical protein HUU16_08855, partial [Candidatus Omnitrophica bacterium]|nr:hypothetical protein [Candidatus Omnitrophota bacterium]